MFIIIARYIIYTQVLHLSYFYVFYRYVLLLKVIVLFYCVQK